MGFNFIDSEQSQKYELAMQCCVAPYKIDLIPDPKKEILDRFTGRCRSMGKHSWNPENAYTQIMQTQNVLGMLGGNPWVILTRPDLHVKIKDIDLWCNEGAYTIPMQERWPEMNDQFAVARLDLMKEAWSFGDVDEMNDLFNKSENPEGVLLKNLNRRNIPFKMIEAEQYTLNPRRYDTDIRP
jgi:hypothetical protein